MFHLSLEIVNFTDQRVWLHLKRPLIFSIREIWQEKKILRKDPHKKTLKMIGGTLEVRSDKSLTLLTFDI